MYKYSFSKAYLYNLTFNINQPSTDNIQIDRVEGVLDALSTLIKAWTDQLKTFNEKDSLGTVTYKNSGSADAGGVVWSLFNDMKEVSLQSNLYGKWGEVTRWGLGFNYDHMELDANVNKYLCIWIAFHFDEKVLKNTPQIFVSVLLQRVALYSVNFNCGI